VGTTKDSIGGDHGLHSVLLKEMNNGLVDLWIKPDILHFREPAFQGFDFSSFNLDDANGYLAPWSLIRHSLPTA